MKSVIGILLLVNLMTVCIYAQSGKNIPSQISITIDDIDLNSNDTPKLTLDQRNLALVGIGRPILYGMAVAGAPGAESVLNYFADDLRTVMLLIGKQRLRELSPDSLIL